MTATRETKVVVATSVMLSFISFWRAAAIVLNDLGSSAYYVGGIAEQAVGRASPWFVLGVMLFSYAVRAVYVESCAMFTRGGVYRVVKEAMGGTLAKLSVSALMFDYILTGPISGVSAGQYIVGLFAQTLSYFGHPWTPAAEMTNGFAAAIAVVVTIYFWWRNTRGIHESSDDALKIMYVTTLMVVLLMAWAGFTILAHPAAQRLPPAPLPGNLVFTGDAAGWMPRLIPHSLRGSARDGYRFAPTAGPLLGLIGILMAFGHSFLAMSGEESLAQVNRELEYPKHRNLMKAGMVIFVYSLLFTSLVSFFAYALIPDAVRPQYFNNLISGIAMYLAGPMPLKLLFQGFIVIVGFLMLAGAINTSIIGSNGVLNRVSEDGVMTDWFRAPHRRYGTTYRMINLVVILQLAAIVGSRGNTYTLGEAYAFGVIWSFAFKGLAMLVLRYKDRSHREWKVPVNLHIGGTELPIGLAVIAAILFSIAGINLITKQVATVSGVAFTLVFFVVFVVSERINEHRRGATAHVEVDQFRLQPQEIISSETVDVRPGNALCVVRDYNTLDHVKKALDVTHTGKRDLVVMTVQVMKGPDAGYEDINENRLFTRYEQILFSRVTAVAEKAGKHVDLLIVPGANVFDAIAQTAANLDSADIWAGRSSSVGPEEQARLIGEAWERLPKKPNHQVAFHIVDPDKSVREFTLGAHVPTLAPADIDLIHALWLEATKEGGVESLHHREIVTVALARLAEDMHGAGRAATIERMRRLRRTTMVVVVVLACLVSAERASAQQADARSKPEPFTFADFTWLTGSPRTTESPLASKAFTGEFRADTNFTFSFNRPQDDTISGSSEVFRSGEIQLTQLGVGGDLHYQNVRGRVMTQFGMYSQTTPRNDASPARGQWNLDAAYRYVSEAYGGYHWDALHGINVDAGIFMSYVGLDSYYQFDNWSYQPSFVSSNTPWFFNGLRVQIFPSDKLKIEPWIVNGWQSYGKFNRAPGIGAQVLWRPSGRVSLLANNYWGTDTPGTADRKRLHTDDSLQFKYYDAPERVMSKAAFTLTVDGGCETGAGVSCGSQFFAGFMAYNRLWFDKDRIALTLGGGAIDNPGRYLVLLPPINGATAASGTPYFTANPGDPFKAWDASVTLDYMPGPFVTFRIEGNHRSANVPYFSGEGGVTPPGGNAGPPGSLVPGWSPDLRRSETRVTAAMLVKL